MDFLGRADGRLQVALRFGHSQALTSPPGLSVTANPTAEWIARQITDAFPWNEAPDHLIRDREASYGHAVTRRLAAMGIRDHPTTPRSPWQNGHAERLIGSIRRECLEHIVVFGDTTYVESLVPTPSITTNSERICRWTRIRQTFGRSSRSTGSRRGRSSAAFIINTAGYSFR
jgi:transposase InsO family protein